jgi:hypothetical protein
LGRGAIPARTDNERFLKSNNERNDDGFGFSNGFWNRKRLRLRLRLRFRSRLRLRSRSRYGLRFR